MHVIMSWCLLYYARVNVRVYAESPQHEFLPSTGWLHHLSLPLCDEEVRIDSGVTLGSHIAPYYDPLLMKVLLCTDYWGDFALKLLYYARINVDLLYYARINVPLKVIYCIMHVLM